MSLIAFSTFFRKKWRKKLSLRENFNDFIRSLLCKAHTPQHHSLCSGAGSNMRFATFDSREVVMKFSQGERKTIIF